MRHMLNLDALFWCLLAGFLLVCTPPEAMGQKLKNPSFEDSAKPKEPDSDHAAYWGRWGVWVNRENSWKPTHSGRAMLGYHHWRVDTEEESGFFQDVTDAEADTPYTFRIYVFRDPKTNARELEVRIEELNGGEVYGSERYLAYDLSHGGWRKLTVTATSPKPGLRVSVRLLPHETGPRKGAIKFDDAKLLRAR